MPTINELPRISTATSLLNIVIPVEETIDGISVTKSVVAADLIGVGYTGSLGAEIVLEGYTGSAGSGGGGTGYTGSRGTAGLKGYTGSAGYYGSFGYTGSYGSMGETGYAGSGSGTPANSFADRSVAFWIGTDSATLSGADNILVADDGINLIIGERYFGVGGTDTAECIAIGYNVLSDNIEGDHKNAIGIGENILQGGGSSTYCIAIGRNALSFSDGGFKNIAIGQNAMFTNTEGGSHNIGIGYEALRSVKGVNNVAIGYCSQRENNGGSYNIAIGAETLQFNEFGNSNIAFGLAALKNNYDGSSNIAIGYNALVFNYGSGPLDPEPTDYEGSGGHNIAIGTDALGMNSYGDGHIAIGQSALAICEGIPNVDTDFDLGDPTYPNIAIGYKSLSLFQNGLSNIGIGTNAGGNILNNGNNNIYIGHGSTASTANANFEIVIGNRSTGKGSSTTYIAGSLGIYNEQNASAWQTVSDQRIKKNIVDNNIGLDVVKSIQVKSFNYKTNEEIPNNKEGKPLAKNLNTKTTATGIIAQDIQSLFPAAVSEDANGLLTVNTDPIFWAMLNSIKQLENELSELESIVGSN